MDTLLIGAVLALLLRGDGAALWQRGSKWLLLVALAVLGVAFAVNPASDGRWMATIGFSLIALASAGLIGWHSDSESVGYRFLRPLRVLGRCSYGFYVYHPLFAAVWAAVVRRFGPGTVVVNFVITFCSGVAELSAAEARFLRWKRRFAYDRENAADVRPYNIG